MVEHGFEVPQDEIEDDHVTQDVVERLVQVAAVWPDP